MDSLRADWIGSGEERPACGLAVDASTIVTRIETVSEARALPEGSVVGDQHGGLTFTDIVAAALESRSHGGWQEIQAAKGEVWTVIVVNW
jgi:hypothetical protein